MTDLPSREPQPVEVPIDGKLTGLLLLSQGAQGLVLFVHGRRSGRHSRRNRAGVAARASQPAALRGLSRALNRAQRARALP